MSDEQANVSEDVRKKMSEVKTGKKLSPETRAKIGAGMRSTWAKKKAGIRNSDQVGS